MVARHICTTLVDPMGLAPLIACRLIALNKCPGVRPIGVGETVRRIIAKSILYITGEDLQLAAGSSQLCIGQESGSEAAVRAMHKIFMDKAVWLIVKPEHLQSAQEIFRDTGVNITSEGR